jgi:hypothetical protein
MCYKREFNSSLGGTTEGAKHTYLRRQMSSRLSMRGGSVEKNKEIKKKMSIDHF